MAEMDPIIRDALKRSSQMQGAQPKHQQRQASRKTENKKQENQSAVEDKTPAYKEQEKAVATDKNIKSNSLSFLFENKDQSLILLLVVLLMNEDSDPMLLLALMYLLI